MADTPFSDRAAALREAFDRGFANAHAVDETPIERLLVVRIRSHRHAIRIGDISGLFVGKKITRLPSPVPALAGVAGLRGAIVPVYDLGLLLGYPRAENLRWLATSAGAPVGLAFDAFEGYRRVHPDAFVPERRGGDRGRHILHVVQGDGTLPVVDVPSVLAEVHALTSSVPSKEP